MTNEERIIEMRRLKDEGTEHLKQYKIFYAYLCKAETDEEKIEYAEKARREYDASNLIVEKIKKLQHDFHIEKMLRETNPFSTWPPFAKEGK